MKKDTHDTNQAESKSVTVDMGNTADQVNSHSPEYSFWMEESLLVRTLTKGTKGMKLAGREFLIMAPLESPASFRVRLENSVLLNAYRKTCSFLAGQVFQVDLTFVDEVPEDMITLTKKVDHTGNDINVFCKRVFQNGLQKGVSHIMVDAPDTGGVEMTQAEERENNIRPYFTEIKPENVIGGIVDEDGNLVQVRIAEVATKRVGKFGTAKVKRIRVLEPGAWELWEEDGGASKSWSLIKEGTFSVNVIPLFTFIPGEAWGPLHGETPLQDLGELNLRHWRSNSDQINILHVGRVPILFGNKVDLNVIPSGVATMITSDEDGADMKFIEIQGAAISAGRQDLEDLKSEMALYGLQQLIPRSGNQTATEKAISSGESNSSLGTWATEFETVIQDAMELMGEYMGQDFPEDGVTANKEFSHGIVDSQEGQLLLKSVEDGVISAQTCFTEFRRRNILMEHLTWDDEEAQMEEEDRGDDTGLGALGGTVFGTAGDGLA